MVEVKQMDDGLIKIHLVVLHVFVDLQVVFDDEVRDGYVDLDGHNVDVLTGVDLCQL